MSGQTVVKDTSILHQAILTQMWMHIPFHHVWEAVQLEPQLLAGHQPVPVEKQSVPSLNVGASSHLPTAAAVAAAVVVVVVVVVAAAAAAAAVVAAAELSVIAQGVLAPQMMRV